MDNTPENEKKGRKMQVESKRIKCKINANGGKY
jgi:hypothetical protein